MNDKVREELLALIQKAKDICANDYSDHTENEYIADMILDSGMIQKQAYWKPMKVYVDEYVCSECGSLFPDFKSEYCYDCGAKMVDAPKDGE